MNTYNEIDTLIAKYLNGEAGPDEAIQLEEWKSQSLKNSRYYNESYQAYHMTYNQSEEPIRIQEAWQKINAKTLPKRRRLLWPLSAAACVTVLLSAVFLMKSNQFAAEIGTENTSMVTYLKDNSKVTLSPHSSIVLSSNFNDQSRKLVLKGKAEFEVEHDEQRPFIVEVENVYFEDLGTIFTIDANPENDTIFVVVKEGIVRLFDQNGSELIIKAGEKAWYIKSQKLIISDLDSRVVKFDFRDTKLTDIVSILDDSFTEMIELQPKSIGRCKLTTQFFDEDLETIVTILTETLDFSYVYKDGKFIITGKPCE